MSQQEPLIGGVQKAEAEAMEEKKPIKAIPINIINGAGSSSEPPLKKKRGRPRKYGPHAKPLAPVAPASPAAPATVAPAASDAAPPATVAQDAPDSGAPVSPAAADAAAPVSSAAPDAGAPVSPAAPDSAAPVAPAAAAAPFTFAAPAAPAAAPPPAAAASADSVKKRRGRPRGSSNKNGLKGKGPAAEASMVPHVIIVKTGEELVEKLMSLFLNGPRNICILAATGEISNITLRKPDTSAGVVTYEGRFEILTLGGSFLFSESGDRSGGINVSLSCPDGRLMGGGVAGRVVAASRIQVVLASFGGEHGCD